MDITRELAESFVRNREAFRLHSGGFIFYILGIKERGAAVSFITAMFPADGGMQDVSTEERRRVYIEKRTKNIYVISKASAKYIHTFLTDNNDLLTVELCRSMLIDCGFIPHSLA